MTDDHRPGCGGADVSSTNKMFEMNMNLKVGVSIIASNFYIDWFDVKKIDFVLAICAAFRLASAIGLTPMHFSKVGLVLEDWSPTSVLSLLLAAWLSLALATATVAAAAELALNRVKTSFSCVGVARSSRPTQRHDSSLLFLSLNHFVCRSLLAGMSDNQICWYSVLFTLLPTRLKTLRCFTMWLGWTVSYVRFQVGVNSGYVVELSEDAEF